MPHPSGSFAVQKGHPAFLWSFTRNGLHVFYQVPGNTQKKSARAIPTEPDDHCKNENAGQTSESTKTCDDIEILALLTNKEAEVAVPEAPKTQPNPMVRTLGGMRLRYRYIAPSLDGIKVTKVTWNFNYKGRICRDYGVESTGCNIVNAGTEYEQAQPFTPQPPDEVGDWSIYWEPVNDAGETDWSNWAGTETNDPGVAATLNAEYTIPATNDNLEDDPLAKRVTRHFDIDFTINTRELKPVSAPAKPMQGSDVAMLEAMFWEFGLSPQKGVNDSDKSNAGGEGNRIFSDRGKKKNGEPRGWTENCDGSDKNNRSLYSGGWVGCATSKVAFEGMVRRFQGRNLATCNNNEDSCKSHYAGHSNLTTGNVNDQTLGFVSEIWKEFYKAYKVHNLSKIIGRPQQTWADNAVAIWDGGGTTGLSATYTDDRHTEVLNAEGMSGQAAGHSRSGLLYAWVDQEASKGFWGGGHPPTDYRLYEGGADEFGSIGYNQIKFIYRYGQPILRCASLANYNMYEPVGNIKAMLAFGASTCGGGFLHAFATNGSWRNITSNDADLVGYRVGTNTTVHSMNTTRVDDAYELLAKAIASYNGPNATDTTTWAHMLTVYHAMKPDGVSHIMGKSYSTRTYAMQVLRRFGFPARTYIWQGGVNPPDKDTEPPFVDDDPLNPNPANIDPDAGQPWCFAFGETEWMNGRRWTEVSRSAENLANGLPVANGTVDPRTPCN